MKLRLFNTLVSIFVLSTAISVADEYTIPISAGYNLIANQLDHGSNTLDEVFGNLGTNGQDGLVLSKYNNGSGNWTVSAYNAASGTWVNGNSITLNPGEGAFLQSPTAFSITFIGVPHVPQLPVTNFTSSPYLLSRQTNDIGTWDNIVGSPPQGGEQVFKYSAGSYTAYVFDDIDLVWTPAMPTAAVGEAVWISPGGGMPPPIPQSLMFQGLLNTSLGNASLAVSSNQLTVGNLGTNGQDGVTIALGGVASAEVEFAALPSNSVPVGAVQAGQAYGTVNGTSHQLLCSASVERTSTNLALSADFSPLGATQQSVQIFSNGISVYYSGPSNTRIRVFIDGIEEFGDYWWAWNVTSINFYGHFFFVVPSGGGGGTATVEGDAVVFQAVNPTNTITGGLSTLALTGSGMSQFTINRESIGAFGLLHTAHGNATLTVQPNQLIVGNLGTNGQDGVSIALPGSLTGLDVKWLDVDASDTLPVGAYIQSKVIGTAAGITNGPLGTLTVSKLGTTNYQIAVDFSALGATTYNALAYYQGVLVGQATNQPMARYMVANQCSQSADAHWGGSSTSPFIINYMSQDWNLSTAQLAFYGSPAFTVDQLEVTPGDVAWTNPPTALQLTASQVPTLTITGENTSLVYQGLNNTSLGNAFIANQLDHGSNRLSVASIGSSGNDGVSIALPSDLTGLTVGWQDLDLSDALPVGAYLQSQAMGMANGITNGVLGTFTVTKAGTSNYVGSVDCSPIGASTFTVRAYAYGVLVGQVTNQPGLALWRNTVVPYQSDFTVGIYVDGFRTGSYSSASPFLNLYTLASSLTVMANHVVITPDNPQSDSVPTALQLTASQVPTLTITGENTSLVYQGLSNTSLGNAFIANQLDHGSNRLSVANLGSSGQDGVSIALGSAASAEVEFAALPSNSVPVGGILTGQSFGTVNGIPNQMLHSASVERTSTNLTVSADFSPIGAMQSVQILNNGISVYNSETSATRITVYLDGIEWFGSIWWFLSRPDLYDVTFIGAMSITVPTSGGGTTNVQGNQVVFQAVNPTNAITGGLGSFAVTGSGGMPGFTIVSETVTPQRPVLDMTLTSGNLVFSWSGGGLLQQSTDLVNWTDVPGALSPFPVSPISPRKFYRVRQ